MTQTQLLLALVATAALGDTRSLVIDRQGDLLQARIGQLRVCLLRKLSGARLAGVSIGDFALLRRDDVLWAAELRDTQGRRRLLNSDMGRPVVSGDGTGLHIVWPGLPLRGADHVDVTVTVAFRPRRSRTDWRIAFTHIPQEWTLYRYLFPYLSLAAEHGKSCAFIEPCDWGTLTRDPLKHLEPRWRIYPRSTVAMQFYGLQRGDRVVYLACHDPRARTKEFLIDRDPGSAAISFGVSQPTRLRYGAAYEQQYPFVLQVLRGDWYDTAVNYRAWALTAPWTWRGPLHRGKKTPKRYLETPVVLLRLGTEVTKPEFVADWAARAQKWFGVPAAYHYYGWHQSFGSMSIDAYPDYFPTQPGFREAVQRMRGAGLQVMPYLNARLWRTDFDSWHELGQRAAVKDVYGECHREVWMKIPAASMNPASRLWQWVIGEAALRCIDCGCSAVYLDQLAESAAWPSYDTNHPHEPGETAAWVQGYWQLCESIRREGREIDRDLVLTAEGNAEPYLSGIDAFLVGNSNAANAIPLYSAAYHDYAMQFGRYVMAKNLQLPRAVLAKFGQQFIFGGQFGWSRAKLDRFLRDDNPHAVCLRKMAKLRTVYRDLLAAGRMLRPLDLGEQVPALPVKWYQWNKLVTVPMPQVLNSVWQRVDGQVGVLLLNIGDIPVSLKLDLSTDRYPVKHGAKARVHQIDGQGKVVRPIGLRGALAVPAATPLLVTFDGVPPSHPEPPPQPVLDMIGQRTQDPKAMAALPFPVPTELAVEPHSERFPFRYEADMMPSQTRPRWTAVGPDVAEIPRAFRLQVGSLEIDTLKPDVRRGMLVRISRGPVWDVDPRVGYTIEMRLRVLASNNHERFAFWIQANTVSGLMLLQVYPDKIVPQRSPAVAADLASAFRTVRLVGLPGGGAARVYLDGKVIADRVETLGAVPHQACVAFGSGASAGRVRALVDYIRFHPSAALAP